MLTLKLDELFGPEIVAAFQKQWSSSPDAALAQAENAVRMIVEPRGTRERMLANFVIALVGPEPDGLAWLEALAVGSFNIRTNVRYAIGRVGESPAKFIKRQRQRIADLAGHPKAKGCEHEYRNAYNDALRLVVATTLLTQLRTGVAAKAAIGTGWPLMAAISEHFNADEKRALFWFGNATELQDGIAIKVREALVDYRETRLDDVPPRADYDRTLPPEADVNDFFRPERRDEIAVKLTPANRRKIPINIPDFIRDAEDVKLDLIARHRAGWRSQLLLSGLRSATASIAIAGFAVRAEKRQQLRDQWRNDANSSMPPDYHVQCAIANHVRAGGFMPPDTPVEYSHYIEEEAAYAFQTRGNKWPGLRVWKDAGFFDFEPNVSGAASFLPSLEARANAGG